MRPRAIVGFSSLLQHHRVVLVYTLIAMLFFYNFVYKEVGTGISAISSEGSLVKSVAEREIINIEGGINTEVDHNIRRRRRRRRNASPSDSKSAVDETLVQETMALSKQVKAAAAIGSDTPHFRPTVAEAFSVLREAIGEKGGEMFPESDGTLGGGGKISTNLHDARVDAALTAWGARQEAMLSRTPLPGESSAPKPEFIAWKVTHRCEHMGLGNRLLGIISAMTLALATGRGFIMAGDDTIVSSVLRSKGIDTSIDRARASVEAAGLEWHEEHLAWGLGMDSKCGCTDFSTQYSQISTITMETTQYLVPCFTHNPSLRPTLVAALGSATAAFRPLLRKFWVLETRLEEELTRFSKVLHPAQGPVNGNGQKRHRRRHVIGLQLRKGHFVRAQHEEATFYRCARQLGLLAEMGIVGSSGGGVGSAAVNPPQKTLSATLELMEDFLLRDRGAAPSKTEELLSAHKGGGSGDLDDSLEVVYFLATDNNEIRNRAREILGSDKVITWSLSNEGTSCGWPRW